jgi:hypothetical protein
MNADDFVPFLGKLDGSPDIAKLLTSLGVKKQPKLKKGDLYVYVQLPKDGLVLVFRESDDPKSSQTFLAGVQMYSDEEDGFKTFAGELPKEVGFDDTKAEVRKKLGKPTRSKDQLRTDYWDRKGHVLSVEYSRATGKVQTMDLSVPLK